MISIFFDISEELYRLLIGPPLSFKTTIVLSFKIFYNLIVISLFFSLPIAILLIICQFLDNGGF